ncbi:nidogen and EGF-like domain-containing 1 [Brachionus plicatilis]|uniref:Nidogen and EGF-like domain-containing 1 n=1 Tax=Brachionus plicatilis TaxID=10195 RepID=A0A3M7S8I5_BRAPC|nr:nidogen and EGF-like domain-containing 1 [Brachionus plicatilis]
MSPPRLDTLEENIFVNSIPILITGTKLEVPRAKFIPYGLNVNDKKLPKNDDDFAGPLNISSNFLFFNVSYDSLWVNTNGVISLNRGIREVESPKFPNNYAPCISPFWSDIDISHSGEIFYREIIDKPTLQIIEYDIQDKFFSFYDFIATWAFVATWIDVPQFNYNNSFNTFQSVLASNGNLSFVIFNYEQLTWSVETAQAGLNGGDGTHYFNLPGSFSSSIKKLTNLSNIGVVGKWMYRTDSLYNFEYGCPSDNLMRFKPSNVSSLGGDIIDITGPCFNKDDLIFAVIDSDQENPQGCVFKNQFTCSITTKKFKRYGRIPVLLIINSYLLYEEEIDVYEPKNGALIKKNRDSLLSLIEKINNKLINK